MTSQWAPRATFTKFEDSTQEEWAEIIRQLPLTQAMAGQNVIDQLRLLERDHGGFPVSRLEHSLQTATRAEEDGRDEEYVLCALIHDIGDTLAPYNHPSIAAGLLKPFVSEANHWMVEHHGIFQGYYFWHLHRRRPQRPRRLPRLAVLRVHGGVLRQVRPDRLRPRLRERPARPLRTPDPQVPRPQALRERTSWCLTPGVWHRRGRRSPSGRRPGGSRSGGRRRGRCGGSRAAAGRRHAPPSSTVSKN